MQPLLRGAEQWPQPPAQLCGSTGTAIPGSRLETICPACLVWILCGRRGWCRCPTSAVARIHRRCYCRLQDRLLHLGLSLMNTGLFVLCDLYLELAVPAASPISTCCRPSTAQQAECRHCADECLRGGPALRLCCSFQTRHGYSL